MSRLRLYFEQLAGEITERHAARHPAAFARYGAIGRLRCREDARFHLEYLDAAIDADAESFFVDYVAWAKVMLASRKVPGNDLAENLRIIESVLHDRFDDDTAAPARKMIRAALTALPSMPEDVPSFIDANAPLGARAIEYLGHLRAGRRREALQLVESLLADQVTVRDIYRHVFEPVQHEIGRLWQLNQLSVAQEHFCTAATEQIMAQLSRRVVTGEGGGKRVVAMSAGGELHEIGLRVLTDLLDLEGWDTYYLGANVPPAAAVQMCIDHGADFLLVSATVAPHVGAVADVIRLFRQQPALQGARIVVGGRAFHGEPELWRRLGADGYAANAEEAVAILQRLAA